MKKKNLIYLIVLFLVTIIFYDLKHIGMININTIKEFVNSFGMLSPIIFILIYIILILIGFSAGIMTISAGILFNPYLAFFLVMIASLTAGVIAFLIGRHFQDKFLKLKKTKHKNLKKILIKIEKDAKEHGFMTILTLRIAFVPYIWLSYFSGVVRKMKFKNYFLAIFITNLWGSFVYIFLGFSITQNLPLFVGALLVLLIFNIILRIYHKKIHKN